VTDMRLGRRDHDQQVPEEGSWLMPVSRQGCGQVASQPIMVAKVVHSSSENELE
jgi:hypothetical protein